MRKRIFCTILAFILTAAAAIPCGATDWYEWLDRFYFEYDDTIRNTINALPPEEYFWDWYDKLSESQQAQVEIPVNYLVPVAYTPAEQLGLPEAQQDKYIDYASVMDIERLEKAKKGKYNVTLEISPAVYWDINYKNINDEVKYNYLDVKFGKTAIPEKLADKALEKNKGIAKSRFKVGVGAEYFCFTGELNIKFGKKYDGKKAKLYRYDKDKKRLVYVDKCDISESGYAAFEVDRAGDYIAVIY